MATAEVPQFNICKECKSAPFLDALDNHHKLQVTMANLSLRTDFALRGDMQVPVEMGLEVDEARQRVEYANEGECDPAHVAVGGCTRLMKYSEN